MSRARVYGAAADRSLTRFLEPSTLARIANLDLLSRTVVEGFISGLHHSPFFGRSLDFAEHRQYMPGDDIRLIDWKLFAHRSFLRQGGGRHQHQLHDPARRAGR